MRKYEANRKSGLRPFTKGKTGNPNGRPKGSKNLSTIVREFEKEDFDWKRLPIKVRSEFKSLGSPWRAIVYVALAQALDGNLRAAEWLRRSAYGIQNEGSPEPVEFERHKIITAGIKPRI